jgi:hypothetical protein
VASITQAMVPPADMVSIRFVCNWIFTEHVPMGLDLLSKNEYVVEGNSYVDYFTQING